MAELSARKRTEIANICYANVSSWFASMCNPENRGSKFEWKNFTGMMVDMSDNWRFIHAVKGNPRDIDELMAQYAREISERMVDASGFAK